MSVQFEQSSGDHLETPAALFSLDSDFTIACWIKTGAALNLYGMIAGQPANSQFVLGIKADGTLFLIVENDSGWQFPSADAVPPGLWTHVAGTYDDAADEVRLYINGVLDYDSPRACATVMSEQANAVHLAGGGSGLAIPGFDGHVADLAIWDRALDAQDIHSLAGGRLVAGFASAGLAAWWPLDVPGDSIFDEAVAAGDRGLQDHTGRGNSLDAVVVGDPDWRVDSPGLHWPARPHSVPFVPSAGAPTTRRVSLGAIFIDTTNAVLVG
ncbi:MAG: LamG domain-containing protein [Phycisphaerae bacterium]